jgi:hypothetical protein
MQFDAVMDGLQKCDWRLELSELGDELRGYDRSGFDEY